MKTALVLVALMGLALIPIASAGAVRDDICRTDDIVPVVERPEEAQACDDYRFWRGVANHWLLIVWTEVCTAACDELNLVLDEIHKVEDEIGNSAAGQAYWDARRLIIPDSCPSSTWTCIE